MIRESAETPDGSPIIGGEFPRREDLRPSRPVADLDEFLAFLDEIEDLFGPIPDHARPNRAERFLL